MVSFTKRVPKACDDRPCIGALRIQLRIENRNIGTHDPSGSHEPRDEASKIVELQPRPSRRVDRRHDSFVEHIQIDVQPARLARTSARSKRPVNGRLHSVFNYPPHGNAKNCGLLDVAIIVVSRELVALTDLHDIAIGHQRPALPVRQQRLAASGREREIHTGGAPEPRGRVVIGRVVEIAVAIDMDQTHPARPCAEQAAKQNAAISSNDERELSCGQTLTYAKRKVFTEAPNALPVADPRPRLRLETILRTRKTRDAG